jgi:predicted transcriptional regulator
MSGNGKRSEVEIANAILHVSLNGAKKSHIIYKANLNFKLGKKYLTRLITAGLIDEPNNGSRVFTTTEKGVEYLKYVDGLKQFLPYLDVGTEAWL